MSFKSIFGGKSQQEINDIISDNESELHVYMKSFNTKADSWITVNDLISAIEQRLIESPQFKTKLVTKNARFTNLNDGEVEKVVTRLFLAVRPSFICTPVFQV